MCNLLYAKHCVHREHKAPLLAGLIRAAHPQLSSQRSSEASARPRSLSSLPCLLAAAALVPSSSQAACEAIARHRQQQEPCAGGGT